MLQKVITSITDVNELSQKIDEITNYGNVSFKKPSIRLSIVVEDEDGNEALQDYEVKIYNIYDINFNSDGTCTFKVKSLTTNNNLKIRLEIIDSNTRLFGVSEYIDFNTSNSNTVSISFKDFDIRNNSEIYYRFLIEDKSLNIKDYYPSANGSNDVSTFSVIKNLVNTKLKSAVYPIGYNKKELDIEQDILKNLKEKIVFKVDSNNQPVESQEPILEDPSLIKQMLDIYTNPSEYRDFHFGELEYAKKDENGKYIKENGKYIFDHKVLKDENGNPEKILSDEPVLYAYKKRIPLNNYGQNIEGLNGNIFEFNIPKVIKDENGNNINRANHLTFERYKHRLFSNGEKILEDKYKSQDNYDGLSKIYVSDTVINETSRIEVQSIKNLINETERFNYVIEITDMDQITKLHNEGLIIDKFFYDPALLTCHVMREVKNSGTYRINLNRFYIRQYNDEQLRITILDPLYAPSDVMIGDKLYITSDIIYEREVLKSNTTAINDGTISYLKPTFFIPFSFITINNNIITDLSSVTNQTEIFINGKCAVPGDDYTIISNNEDLNLPSLILFKNLLFSNTTIEIIFNGTTIDNSFKYYQDPNPNRTYFVFTLDNLPYPLIDGCYDVYSNNYKVPNSIVETLSDSKFRIVSDGITRNISPTNIYIKFNYANNKIIETLLRKYAESSTNQTSRTTLKKDECIDKTRTTLKKDECIDKKGITFAEFIWDLDENNKEVFQLKDIYNLLGSENHANILNCKESNIVSGNDFIPNNINIPYLFNHKINIHSFSYLTQENFRDNISILNPSRILQISNINELESFNCKEDKYAYDIFLNEEIPINVDYINEDIEIDCNKIFK